MEVLDAQTAEAKPRQQRSFTSTEYLNWWLCVVAFRERLGLTLHFLFRITFIFSPYLALDAKSVNKCMRNLHFDKIFRIRQKLYFSHNFI